MVFYNKLIKTTKLESTFYFLLVVQFFLVLRFGEIPVMFKKKIISINFNDSNTFLSLPIRHIFSDFIDLFVFLLD